MKRPLPDCFRLSLGTVLLLSLVVESRIGHAARPHRNDASSDRPAMRFRPFYLPHEQIHDLLRGPSRFVPVRREEFHQLVESINRGEHRTSRLRSRIEHAKYHARFTDGDSLFGNAQLDIVHGVPQATLLQLDGLGLALANPRWSDSQDALPGLSVGLTDQGKSAAVVDRDGSILFDWSLRGNRDAYGVLTFHLALAACPSTSVTLDLPANFIPFPDRGVVSGPEIVTQVRPVAENTAGPPVAHRWLIQFGAHAECTLRVVPRHLADAPNRLVLLRQNSSYTIAERGLDLSVELNVHVYHAPLSEMFIELDPGLQLTTVRYGNKDVPWSVWSVEGQTTRRAVLELTEPVTAKGGVFQLAAVAPVNGHEPFRLPTLRTQNALWQEGRMAVHVEAPLLLAKITPFGCHATSRSLVPGKNLTESAEFLMSQQDATVTVELATQFPSAEGECATTIRWSKTQLAARFTGDFRSEDGQLFDLVANLHKDWIVDTVESLSSDRIADWKVESASGEGTRQLRIRLNESLNPKRELRLSISGRRRRAASDETLGVADFLFADFERIPIREHWISLQAEAPLVLKISRESNLRRGNVEELTTAQRERIGGESFDLLFLVDDNANSLEVGLSAQPAKFAVDINVEADATTNLLSEIHTFRVTPESNYVDSLLVRFSAKRNVDPIWTIADEPDGGLVPSRLPSKSPFPGRDNDPSETWELRLNRPRRSPFEIRAVRASPFDTAIAVALASVTNAADQNGLLTIQSNSSTIPDIDNYRLHPVPVASVPTIRHSTFRAAYRFDPKREALATGNDAFVVSPKLDSPENPQSWIWSRTIRSKFSTDGTSRHVITYDIENSVQTEIRLVAPEYGRVRRVLVDSHNLSLPESFEENGAAISLPEGRRHSEVTVEIESIQQPLRTWDKLSAPQSNINLPILFSQWKVKIPPSYKIVANPHLGETSLGQSDWRRRLFGVLARTAPTGYSRTNGHSSETTFVLPSSSIDARTAQMHPLTANVDVSVYDSARYEAFAWATFMATAAVVGWQSRRTGAHWFLFAGTIGSLALVVPEYLVPIASQMMMGTFLGGLIALCPSLPVRDQSDGNRRDTRRIGNRIAVGSWLLATLWFVSPGSAQTPGKPLESPTESSLAEPLYIPVGADGQSTGDPYYLTESSHAMLQQRGKALESKTPDSLIQRAQYELFLDWEIPGTRLSVVSCQATIDVEVFRGDTSVQLPFRGAEVRIEPNEAQVDGRTVPVRWLGDSGLLEVPIREAGRYRLAMKLRPRPQERESLHGWDLTIPPVADSRLTIRVPADAPAIDVPSRIGAMIVDREQQMITADMGPTHQLSIRWTGGTGIAGTSPRLDIEELHWLRIRPGSVVLDCRMSLKVSDGYLGSLSMRVDPRLRLLPRERASTVRAVHVPPDQPQTLVFELNEPNTDQVTVEARFLVTDTSGIGRILFPRLESNGTIARRWMAASTTADLELVAVEGGDRPEIGATEFARAWGGNTPPPQYAVDGTSGSKDPWFISTQPRAPETAVDQRLTMVFGQSHADVNLQLDLMTINGLSFHHRISGPSNIDITAILLADAAGERRARWSRHDDGIIHVFLDPASATDRTRMTLHGQIPLTAGEKTPLPLFRMPSAETRSNFVTVYRRPGVSLDIDEITGMNVVNEASIDANRSPDTRRVNAWEIVDENPSARARINSSTTLVEAIQVTSLIRRESGWHVEVEVHGKVEQGVIDVLHFKLPPVCGSEIEVTPDVRSEIVELPGVPDRQLHLHLPDAETDRFQFRVTMPVTFGPGQRVHVPNLRSLEHRPLAHYVVVPNEVESQPVEWDTLLRTAQIPDDFSSRQPDDLPGLVFRADHDEFLVEMRTGQRAFDLPLVRLADIVQRWQPGGLIHGMATFDLEPNGLPWCPIRLPKGTHMIQARVDALPARMVSADTGTWRLALASSVLPQRIEIVYVGQLDWVDLRRRSLKVHAPQLGDITVLHTLFTVINPSRMGSNASDNETDAIGAARQQLFRLKELGKLMELPTHLLTEETPDDIAVWYRPWIQQYWEARRELERWTDLEAATATPFSDEVEALDRQQTYIASHLGTNSILAQVRDRTQPAGPSNRRFISSPEGNDSISRFLFTGPKSSIVLTYASTHTMRGFQRFFAAFAVAGLTWWAARRPSHWVDQWTGYIFRWPALTGVILGAGWLLWLRPGWIGWAIIIVSIAGSFSLPATIQIWAHRSHRPILLRGRDHPT